MSKRIIITGASGGFGRLTVEQLLKNGHQVVGTMRDPEGRNASIAETLRAAGAHIVEMDVTQEESVNNGVSQAIDLLGGLDVVINNAGIGVAGMQEHFTPEDFQKLFDINVFGVQRVNRAALPHLREQGHGLLVHISSLLGRITLPFYGPYNASKWALEAVAENYRCELSPFGVESCIVEPGGYPTTFMENLMLPSDNGRTEAYGDFMQVPGMMSESFQQALANNPAQRPEKVAEAIVNVIETPNGQRPMRTVVDEMGMGAAVGPYNEQLEGITQNLYGAFQLQHLLSVQPENS